MVSKSTTGLILVGGAIFLLANRGTATDTQTLSGGNGWGSGELSNPNSTGPAFPNVVINESQDVLQPSSSSPTSKKTSTPQSISQKTFYNKQGVAVGIQDSPLASNPQSRLTTPTEQLSLSKKNALLPRSSATINKTATVKEKPTFLSLVGVK